MPLCHFYNKPGGCRNGDSCRFEHRGTGSTVVVANRSPAGHRVFEGSFSATSREVDADYQLIQHSQNAHFFLVVEICTNKSRMRGAIQDAKCIWHKMGPHDTLTLVTFDDSVDEAFVLRKKYSLRLGELLREIKQRGPSHGNVMWDAKCRAMQIVLENKAYIKNSNVFMRFVGSGYDDGSQMTGKDFEELCDEADDSITIERSAAYDGDTELESHYNDFDSHIERDYHRPERFFTGDLKVRTKGDNNQQVRIVTRERTASAVSKNMVRAVPQTLAAIGLRPQVEYLPLFKPETQAEREKRWADEAAYEKAMNQIIL